MLPTLIQRDMHVKDTIGKITAVSRICKLNGIVSVAVSVFLHGQLGTNSRHHRIFTVMAFLRNVIETDDAFIQPRKTVKITTLNLQYLVTSQGNL